MTAVRNQAWRNCPDEAKAVLATLDALRSGVDRLQAHLEGADGPERWAYLLRLVATIANDGASKADRVSREAAEDAVWGRP